MNHAAAMYRKVIVAHDSNWGFRKHNDDLDATVTNNARISKESYVICLRDEPEPDKEYLGRSAHDADPDQKFGVTLLERLIHGLMYFIETKRHLDEKGWTLCSGSRCAGGAVPYVYWSPDGREVRVSWCGVWGAASSGGLRQAVSL
jgi:hypothetical protein